MKTVCFLSHSHLCINPRLRKEVFAAARAGYSVHILTVFFSDEKLQLDLELISGMNIRYEGVEDIRPSQRHKTDIWNLRLRRKLAKWRKKFTGKDSRWLLGVASPRRFLRRALELQADLYIAHLESGFYVGRELVKHNCRVAFDFEDWYSRDYLVPDRPVRLLSELESFAMAHGVFCTCTSKAMAEALQLAYPAKHSPVVVYNVFSRHESPTVPKPWEQRLPRSIVWFSQTIGPGRGLETFIESIREIDRPVELHLLGRIAEDYKTSLLGKWTNQQGHRLHFHPPVPHAKLSDFLQDFSLGIALEQTVPDNKDLTISNKAFQYIQYGLRIIASRTKGQMEIASAFPEAIFLLPGNNPKEWSSVIEEALNSPAKDPAELVRRFNAEFAWEVQEERFLQLLKEAI